MCTSQGGQAPTGRGAAQSHRAQTRGDSLKPGTPRPEASKNLGHRETQRAVCLGPSQALAPGALTCSRKMQVPRPPHPRAPTTADRHLEPETAKAPGSEHVCPVPGGRGQVAAPQRGACAGLGLSSVARTLPGAAPGHPAPALRVL